MYRRDRSLEKHKNKVNLGIIFRKQQPIGIKIQN